MKINKLNNSVKRAFMALMFASLSFSSASANNYIINNGEGLMIEDELQISGSFTFFGNSTVDIENSRLGTSFNGRFSIFSNDPTPAYQQMNLYNSTLYVDSIYAPKNFTLNVKDNSFLFADDNTINMANLYVENSTLVANGIRVSSLNLESNSTWNTSGSSTITTAFHIHNGSTVNLTITSAFDAIKASGICYIGDVYFNFNFSDDFIDSIMYGAGYYDLVFADTIVGDPRFATGASYSINVADSNGTYTWIVTDLGHEIYRLSDFQLIAIPEPSTYAAIFGVIALAFVAYRRRK